MALSFSSKSNLKEASSSSGWSNSGQSYFAKSFHTSSTVRRSSDQSAKAGSSDSRRQIKTATRQFWPSMVRQMGYGSKRQKQPKPASSNKDSALMSGTRGTDHSRADMEAGGAQLTEEKCRQAKARSCRFFGTFITLILFQVIYTIVIIIAF